MQLTPEMLAEFRMMVRCKILMWDAASRLEDLLGFEVSTADIDVLCADLDSADDVLRVVGMRTLQDFIADQPGSRALLEAREEAAGRV